MCCVFFSQLACDEDKPYTPFQVATSLPNDEKAPNTPKADHDQQKRESKWATSLRAPAGSTAWKAFGRTLSAPKGTELHVGLPILNSESDEVTAWVLPDGERKRTASEPGLWLFDAAGKPIRRLLALPDFVPQGNDCRLRAELTGTGPTTFTSRLDAECSSRLLPGTPTTSLAVVDSSRSDPTLVHLRSQEAAPGERLDLIVDSTDQDGDGSDDVRLSVELTAPSGAKESLPLLWLSRTAGASRQPDSPRVELSKRASRLSIAAVRKAERGAVTDEVDALRRLLSSVCGELGKPRLSREGGDPLACGDIQGSLEQLAHVEVQALLGQDKLEDALGAYERADWFGTNFDAKRRKKMADLVLAAIPNTKANRLARFNVETQSPATPHASPLKFTDDGQLFAKCTDKTKRLTMEGDPPLITPATDSEPEKRIEPPEWSMSVTNSKGLEIQAALPSCDRSEVLLAFSTKKPGQQQAPVPLSQLAPRPGTCRAFAPTPLSVVPLSADGGSLVAVVGGQRVSTRGHVRPPSEPVAWSTSLGIAVHLGSKLVLLTGEETDGLHHCVVDEKSKKVACSKKGSVSVFAAPK